MLSRVERRVPRKEGHPAEGKIHLRARTMIPGSRGFMRTLWDLCEIERQRIGPEIREIYEFPARGTRRLEIRGFKGYPERSCPAGIHAPRATLFSELYRPYRTYPLSLLYV